MSETVPQPLSGTRGFLPAVEGLRACAAVGVVVTHVALQTAHLHGVCGRLLARLDMSVAVFFALSGFLLWRAHAAAAAGRREGPETAPYLRSRLVRIMPAYLLTVVVVLSLLPEARSADSTVWIANLTLTQIYVPKTLFAGLTQMWSLSVEVSFYLVLPLLAFWAAKLPVRARIPVIAAAAVLSLGWPFVPIPAYNGGNPLNWLPAYTSWFAIGMLLAELTFRPVGWPHRLARRPLAMGAIAITAYLIGASPLAIPFDSQPAGVGHYVVRMVVGVAVAGALLAPLVLGRRTDRHRVLASAPMLMLGRWSYGLFLWHLAALDMVLTLVGAEQFPGDLAVVAVLTTGFGVAIAAVSYALLEEPCRVALRRWESARSQVPVPAGAATVLTPDRAA